MKIFKTAMIITLATWIAAAGFAAEAKRTAILTAVEGTVEIKPLKGEWVPGRANTALAQGDFIKTGKNSWAVINIDGENEIATVELKESSNMELSMISKDEKTGASGTLLDLYAGEVLVKAKNLDKSGSKFDVKTPTSMVAVQGGSASFSVKVEHID